MGFLKVGLIVLIASYVIYRFLPDGRPDNLQDFLTGKNVVITGASSGIGKQFALYYAKQGANVVIIARREKLLQEVVNECENNSPLPRGKAVFKYLVADLENVESSTRAMQKSIELLGGTLDYLVLNHAYLPTTSEVVGKWVGVEEQMRGMNRSLNINFLSYVHMASAALPVLKQTNGSICAISSFGAELSGYSLPYGTSKGALNSFFTGLRQELLHENINISVTLVHLGLIHVENTLETLTAMSKAQGKDIVEQSSVLPRTSGDQAATDIAWATLSREADIYYPSNQHLWVFCLMRLLIPNIDSHMILIENALSLFLNAKKYIGL